MKTLLMILAVLTLATSAMASDAVLLGVLDGPLGGGTPKFIEIFVCNDVTDMSIYALGVANNGGGSDGPEFYFDAGPVAAGTSIYVSYEDPLFQEFMGFAPTYVNGIASINGDDAVELFCNDLLVDSFGEVCCDGSGSAWEYLDSWAKRSSGTGPDGTFAVGNWIIAGPNVLDGELTNDTAATPYPVGSYTCDPAVPTDENSWGTLKSLFR